MTIDIILTFIGALMIILGFIGSILPGIPGPPLAYIGLIFMHITERFQFSTATLIIGLILVLITIVADYVLPVIGVSKWNGSKWGNIGCVIGTIIGVFFFSPLGIIFGPFIGAVVGEMMFADKDFANAMKAGFGAFIGFLLGTVLKLSVCGWFAICFIKELV